MGNVYLEQLFSLAGRTALVTGASSGIGRELARGLAAAGARVALVGRSADRLAENRAHIVAGGGSAEWFVADLMDLDAIPATQAEIETRLGPVDILVNCAGVNQREQVLDVQPETYDRLMATNLRAPYFLTRALAPGMIARGGGKVINVGSLNTSWGGGNLSVYGMTKSAIAQMTRVMAVEWATRNIQVNCLCPGWIETELTQPLWSDPHKRQWLLERIPAARPGAPADLTGITLYLASRASDYTTGQTFYVDGGFTAGGQW